MAREARLRDRAVLSAFLVGDDIASSETTSSEMSVSTGEDGGPAAAAAEPSHPPMPNPMGPTPMDVIAHQMASLSAAELQQVVAHAASHMAHRSGSPCASPMAAAPLPLPGAYLQPLDMPPLPPSAASAGCSCAEAHAMQAGGGDALPRAPTSLSSHAAAMLPMHDGGGYDCGRDSPPSPRAPGSPLRAGSKAAAAREQARRSAAPRPVRRRRRAGISLSYALACSLARAAGRVLLLGSQPRAGRVPAKAD